MTSLPGAAGPEADADAATIPKMAAVVASDSGEIPYVLQDAGVVIPEDDLGQWTERIDRLIVDSSSRAQLTARGLARARAEGRKLGRPRRHISLAERMEITRLRVNNVSVREIGRLLKIPESVLRRALKGSRA